MILTKFMTDDYLSAHAGWIVLIPFRVFDDSDLVESSVVGQPFALVLIPFRVFDDSDKTADMMQSGDGLCLNTLPSIR